MRLNNAADAPLAPLASNSRMDAFERLHQALEAVAYDKWFCAEVEQALREANAPDAQWVSHEDVKAKSRDSADRWRKIKR